MLALLGSVVQSMGTLCGPHITLGTAKCDEKEGIILLSQEGRQASMDVFSSVRPCGSSSIHEWQITYLLGVSGGMN